MTTGVARRVRLAPPAAALRRLRPARRAVCADCAGRSCGSRRRSVSAVARRDIGRCGDAPSAPVAGSRSRRCRSLGFVYDDRARRSSGRGRSTVFATSPLRRQPSSPRVVPSRTSVLRSCRRRRPSGLERGPRAAVCACRELSRSAGARPVLSSAHACRRPQRGLSLAERRRQRARRVRRAGSRPGARRPGRRRLHDGCDCQCVRVALRGGGRGQASTVVSLSRAVR